MLASNVEATPSHRAPLAFGEAAVAADLDCVPLAYCTSQKLRLQAGRAAGQSLDVVHGLHSAGNGLGAAGAGG